MNKEQQKLYDKLLKKVNEYCLGYAAEDVIAAIDELVENYEKHEKALEIIKNKKVNVNYLFSREVNDYIDYNVWSGCENLTAEECEFLKEVLK